MTRTPRRARSRSSTSTRGSSAGSSRARRCRSEGGVVISFKLVRRNLLKHKVRSGLTIGSLIVAILLLCVLQSLVVALTAGVRGAKRDRLIVQSAVSLFVGLPLNYSEKLAKVEGVKNLCKFQWFG